MEFQLEGREREEAIERVQCLIRHIIHCDNELQVFRPHDNGITNDIRFSMEEAKFELSILLQCLYNEG